MWCDVVRMPGGGFGLVRSVPNGPTCKIEVLVDDRLVWSKTVATDDLRYLRCAVSPAGDIAAIGQGGEGGAWLVEEHAEPRAIAATFGQDCVAIRHDGTRFVTYVQTSADQYLRNGEVHPMPWSSQGFREVHPDGTIDFGEDFLRKAEYNGYTFWRRTVKDGFVVGQSGRGIGFLRMDTRQYWSVDVGPIAEGVHFAVDGQRLMVCAFTKYGAWSRIFQPPYPVEAAPVPVPVRHRQPRFPYRQLRFPRYQKWATRSTLK